MVVALKTRRRSTLKVLRYVATGVLVAAALVAARHGWRIYMTSPWTRDGMVRVQVANVDHRSRDRLSRCEPTTINTLRGRPRSQESAERPAGGSYDTVHLD